MKARWIRNATDALSSLYETEGGPLPRYVAAFPELDGTVTLYEADIDGRFKKANALKGSGHTRTAEVSLTKLGYIVTKGSLTLYPDGHEHAVPLDRRTADEQLRAYCTKTEKASETEFARGCRALMQGNVETFKTHLEIGFTDELKLMKALGARNLIREAKFADQVLLIVSDIVLDRRDAQIEATVKRKVAEAMSILGGARVPNSERIVNRSAIVQGHEPGWHLPTDPCAYFGTDEDNEPGALTRELDRMNAELAAKQLPGRGFGKTAAAEEWVGRVRPYAIPDGSQTLEPTFTHTTSEREAIAREAARLAPPRPLWERALVAGSPEAPRVDHRSALWIGRGLDAFRFGDIAIPMDMIGSQTTWDEMAMEVYRAWIALKPGEQILNYIGRRSWCASTVIRPEVLP